MTNDIGNAVSNGTARQSRPRVLAADEDGLFLRSVSGALAAEFDVVATVSDGRQLLDSARRLEPDIIVLDMSLRGADGPRTAGELKQTGSRAKIVFLTLQYGEEHVAAAVRSGADSCVLKSRMTSDLSVALHHALGARRSLPLLAPLGATEEHSHAVHFHTNDTSWLDEAAGFLSKALTRGDACAVVMTESDREATALRLKKQGWDVGEMEAIGRYLPFDTAASTAQFMRDRRVDADALGEFDDTLERARLASTHSSDARLTLIGNLAASLCRRGDVDSALELERSWNELIRARSFLSVCAYPVECFDGGAARGLVADICASHSMVTHDPNVTYDWASRSSSGASSHVPYVAVVEDDWSLREAIRRLLRASDIPVRVFASGGEFLESDCEQAACVVLDVHMPLMSGWEVQAHLSAAGCRTPVVYMTADRNDALRRRALDAGAAAFLVKPFSDDELLSVLHDHIDPPARR
jgi:CheY-like chemotaxis protein